MTDLRRHLSLIPPTAEVQQVQAETKAEAPDPSDVLGTMKYWDAYRARERARFAAMDIKLNEYGDPIPGQSLSTILKIDEFPDFEHPENIPDADAADRRKTQALQIAFVEATRQSRPWYKRALAWFIK